MLDQTTAKKLNDHLHGVGAFTLPASLRCRLMTAVGNAGANGTELVTGGGYTSGVGAPLMPFSAATTASPSVAANSGVVSITNMPATTINGIEIWSGVPERLELGSLTVPRTTASGDTLSFAASAVTSSLGG
jgi:hypothetical protein